MSHRLIILLLMLMQVGCRDQYEKTYYENGQLKSRAKIRDGHYDGDFTTFYPDGKLKAKGVWNGTIRNGFIEKYSENGRIKEQSFWKDNLQDGPAEVYFQDGSVHYRGNYREGMKVGEHLLFFEDGQIQDRTIYDEEGNLIYMVKFAKERNKLTELVFPSLLLERDGDSVKLRVQLKLPVKGRVLFAVIKKDGEELLEITPPEFLTGSGGTTLRFPLPENVSKYYYQFDYTPADNDSLSSFGYHKKLIRPKEKPKEFSGFS